MRPSGKTGTPLLYVVTDRLKLAEKTGDSSFSCLVEFIRRAIAAGVDMIQIRERDLTTQELVNLVDRVSCLASSRTRLLVNDRADVAAAQAGVGVHLATRSIPPHAVREAFGNILIGASTHTLGEIREAEESGADFVVFGPVFDTESKRKFGPPAGLDALKAAVAAASIPVLGIGGITADNYSAVLEAGAAGLAAISLFIDTNDLSGLVALIRSGPTKC